MDNEATRLINDDATQRIENTVNQPAAPQARGSKKGNTVAGAVGGFVAGAAVGVGATAAANTADAPAEEAVAAENETPAPEEAILANDEGVRVAHVDADNFNDAFAQAREQVGPGGVFEFEGRLYGTYYANEWNAMTAEERVDYQNRVNEVTPAHPHTAPASAHHGSTAPQHHETAQEPITVHEEIVDVEPADNEIRVLGVETLQTEDGQIMNVALVENGGDQALLVDVDNDGMIEAAIHDDNYNGSIEENEVHDISEAGIGVDDLAQMQAAQTGETAYTAYDDGMPDYVNDADSIMSV